MLNTCEKKPEGLKQNKISHYVLAKATMDTVIKIDKDIAHELIKRRVAVIKALIIIKLEIKK